MLAAILALLGGFGLMGLGGGSSSQSPRFTDTRSGSDEDQPTAVTDTSSPEPTDPADEPTQPTSPPPVAVADDDPTEPATVSTPAPATVTSVTPVIDPVPVTTPPNPDPAPTSDPVINPAPNPDTSDAVGEAPSDDVVAVPDSPATPVIDTGSIDPEPQPEPAPAVVSEANTGDISAPAGFVITDLPDAPSTPDASPDPAPDLPETSQLVDAQITHTVTAGRVATLDLEIEGEIASVNIVEGLDYGNVTVNPDNSLAVVLTGTEDTTAQDFTVEVLTVDGTLTTYDVNLDVEDGTLAGGWGQGEHYMLATDANDDLIVEHGDIHREVHVSGSDDALSLQDIATLEGLDVDEITGRWLEAHPEYGSSPNMALAEDAAYEVWNQITGTSAGPTSHHLLFEAGYEYDDMGFVLARGTMGESELHPVYVGSYGEGDTPVINSQMIIAHNTFENVVIQGVDLNGGVRLLTGENIAFDDVEVGGTGASLQDGTNVTFRNSDIVDIIRETPIGGNNPDIWSGHANRVGGIYADRIDGLLVEGVFIDHTGWADDYAADLSTDSGQPPSMWSHNLYLNYENSDLTLRDTISMRAAANGFQVRSGGFIEDNVFIDNNVAGNFNSGSTDDGDIPGGNYTLFHGNVITAAGYRAITVGPQGGLSLGLSNAGVDATLLDNIITHLTDPNNPDELDAREVGHNGYNVGPTPYYDNTIVYNWVAGRNAHRVDELNINTDGLDEGVLDATTIQLLAAEITGIPGATIADLANHLRAQAEGELDDVVDADLITAYFQEGFGLSTDLSDEVTDVRFIPSDLGAGVRWDNRINWDSDTLPQTGQNVDLGGNWVNFGDTVSIDDLTLGEGGQLTVAQGALQVTGNLDSGGGTIAVDDAGQLWLNGYSDTDMLTLTIDGGRVANTGDFNGRANIDVSDNGQLILGTDDDSFIVRDDTTISITGSDTRVGFDGENGGVSVLLLEDDATLSLTADGGLGQISEFRSGAFGDDGEDIRSGANLGNADLHLDLTDIAGGAGMTHTLIELDEIVGTFDNIQVTGLSNTQDVTITVNYETDTVVLALGDAGDGSGEVTLETAGNETRDTLDTELWDALTAGVPPLPEDLPEDPVETLSDAAPLG